MSRRALFNSDQLILVSNCAEDWDLDLFLWMSLRFGGPERSKENKSR